MYYNVVELFSGIGSQAKALRNIGLDINLVGTSEWDIHAIIAYDLIHNSDELPIEISRMSKLELLNELEKFTFSNSGKKPLDSRALRSYKEVALKYLLRAVKRNHNFVDINKIDGGSISENVDILTYSFPCQDLSNVGALHGYTRGIDKNSGSRSSLLWQVGRILSEMKAFGRMLPRILLMENVPTLLSSRHFSNFSTWISDLRDLGYVSKYFQLNASDFGLPQNRPRLLMISVFVGDDKEKNQLILDFFKFKSEKQIIQDYLESKYFHKYTVRDMLRTNYENKDIYEEALECIPNDTISRRKIWNENPQIIREGNIFNDEMDVVRTITTKQDRNPNSGNLYCNFNIKGKSFFRYLTPRECLLFMGFSDEDYLRLKSNNIDVHSGAKLFARDKVIHMAGNSIPVKMLEGIFLQIINIDNLLKNCKTKEISVLEKKTQKESPIDQITHYLFSHKIRCRKPTSEYLGRPDAVFPKYKTVLFVYDCFLHSHNCDNHLIHQKNLEYWKNKIVEIKKNDKEIQESLRKKGWNILIVWSCELSRSKRDATLKRIEESIVSNI